VVGAPLIPEDALMLVSAGLGEAFEKDIGDIAGRAWICCTKAGEA
jgi:hypothetical protein